MTITVPVTTRNVGIDRLRGLAIIVMILDHVLLVEHGPLILRFTVTRIAMPLFFLLAGHLAKRMTFRVLEIGLLGTLLPYVVSFVDKPNVLFWYAVFVPIIVVARRSQIWLAMIVLFSLTTFANYYGTDHVGTSYEPVGLIGIMALGALLPRSTFDNAKHLPAFLTAIGKWPITIYVSHLLILGVIQ